VLGHEGTIALLGADAGVGANLAVEMLDEVSRFMDYAGCLMVAVESHFH
jgi:hypothetical protein